MVADKSPAERKQHRETTLVGRDKASGETVQYMNQLRERIQDPAAAELAAMLHAQINGDHPDYKHPPDQTPFGHWHGSVTVAVPTVTSTTSTSATVSVELTEAHLLDSNVTITTSFIEQTDTIDFTVVEPSPATAASTGTVEFTTDKLTPGTEYAVQATAEADVDVQTVTDYSDRVSFTTPTQ